jgi:hypothetical protein
MLEPVMVAAQGLEVAVAGRSLGVGNAMIDIAATGWLVAAGEHTTGIPGSHEAVGGG